MKKWIGIGVILAAFAVLVVSSMKSNTMRSIPVSELRASEASAKPFVGQRLRVVGFVGKQPVRSVPEPTASGVRKVHHFMVEDKDKMLAVEYRDALPDTFRAGGPVQVDGVYTESGLMQADHVFTKCPSKYEAESNARMKKPESKSSDVKTSGQVKAYGESKASAELKTTAAPQTSGQNRALVAASN